MADFVSENNEKSLQFARQNVQKNKLQQRIKLLQTSAESPLLPLDQMKLEMCISPVLPPVQH
jgi:tRNA1(Val) A37 N6-methylase TrmN6